ncbi:hypothetical protein K7957_05225 [Sphingomonas yunnanensis]|uniref:hypothetical protein n=1 Tax=Sphingomonas yunnanensis TaxID=310400 RepID=UPI001CA6C59F|nr:hypothetical protein [Sphingomonas yunnanensis]MBY9062331.1 hypothetical protein [Sphingomonas yunnanensis]
MPPIPSAPDGESRLKLLQRARRYALLAEQARDPALMQAYREEAADCLRRAEPPRQR